MPQAETDDRSGKDQHCTGADRSGIYTDRQKGTHLFWQCIPIGESLKRLEIGGALGCGELLRICKVLQNAGKVKAYGRHDTQEELCDCLDVYFEQLEPLFPLTAEIERCIQERTRSAMMPAAH